MDIEFDELLPLNQLDQVNSAIPATDYFMLWKDNDEDPKRILYSKLVEQIGSSVLGGFSGHEFIQDYGAATVIASPKANDKWLNTYTNLMYYYVVGSGWVLKPYSGKPDGYTSPTTVYICDKSQIIPLAPAPVDNNVYSLSIKGANDYYLISKVLRTPRMKQESVLGKGNAVTTIAAKTNTSYDITGTVNELNVQSFENSFETETLISWSAGASPSLTMAAGMIMVSNIILQPNKRTVMVISRNTYALGQE